MKRNLCQPCREKGVVVLEFCGGWFSEPTATDSRDLYQSSILSLLSLFTNTFCKMAETGKRQKTVIVGAGPVGALAALYAAQRGHDVEVYELRSGAFTL